MVDPRILDRIGCSKARLKQIFTCKDQASEDWKIKTKFEDDVRTRIAGGMAFCAQQAPLYQAVDMAWDSTPVQKETIPLQLYAQGKIKIDDLKARLSALKISDRFCTKDDKGNIKELSVPKLTEVTFSLIRSYTMRRHAAQSARFTNLWPYFKYDPRGTSFIDKLRADVTSQRMDIMTDDYGYRHLGDQAIREAFLYAHSVIFPTCAWDRQVQWRLKDNTDPTSEIEAVVEREGVELISIHPTRTAWDRSRPLANINTDTGPDWILYWDIVRFGTIANNPAFFNIDAVRGSDSLSVFFKTYPEFMLWYFDPKIITPPDFSFDPAQLNDRALQAPYYGAQEKDKGVALTSIRMRINPKQRGIGDYPYDVWLNLTVASDDTIVGAEFLPSLPACYGGINEHDGRLVNPSQAHDLMGFQDQCTNILSQLLMDMKASLLQIWCIDQDALEPAVKKYIEETMAGKNYYVNPMLLMYSGTKIRDEQGTDPAKMVQVIRANLDVKINETFDALMKLLAIVERLMVMSPNETGQPNPREVSARETQVIASSVESIYSFIANGIDEQRQAIKKLIYESTLVCSTSKFVVPATKRYSRKTIADAGFKVQGDLPDGKEDVPDFHTIIATGDALGFGHIFTARDGDERTSDVESAKVIMQGLQTIAASPALTQLVGPDRLKEMLSQAFRMLGVYDLSFDDGEGEPQQMDPQKLDQILQLLNDRLTKLEQLAGGGAPPPQGPGGAPIPAPVAAPPGAAPTAVPPSMAAAAVQPVAA